MSFRKESFLKRHRRKKRVALAIWGCLLVAVGLWAEPVWVLPLLGLSWAVHEIWFADHVFYAPNADYTYRFDGLLDAVSVAFSGGRLMLGDDAVPPDENDTLLLEVTLRSDWMGRLFDPSVRIEAEGTEADCQTFERGASGVRVLNLTGFAGFLRAGQGSGLSLRGKHCRLEGLPRLWRAVHPDYRQKRLLVVAPHADDAELAAFGLYSQAEEAWIVTLTAGETESGHYRRFGLNSAEAARFKGRLRSWDSVAIPRWGGIPAERAVQLGYFGLQLPAMQSAPAEVIASRDADICDTRPFRSFNHIGLSSDQNGLPSWKNLLSDLREIILAAKPDAIVLPHPQIDPHPDHVAAHYAVSEALAELAWQPAALIYYANHLSGTDRWPMGEAHCGIAPPPLFEEYAPFVPWALRLEKSCQIDKALALGMMHDLTAVPLSLKKRCRCVLQRLVLRRRHPPYGENDYFRKAVRRHELFWVEERSEHSHDLLLDQKEA
ncbi:MAG: PIG-L family deacetylase [Azoarcus sp.]|jgi:LmbE family N-acetylglucosaminyl deacetylase|nr:PIG-L family deacetylase [Azoarcus sp.]